MSCPMIKCVAPAVIVPSDYDALVSLSDFVPRTTGPATSTLWRGLLGNNSRLTQFLSAQSSTATGLSAFKDPFPLDAVAGSRTTSDRALSLCWRQGPLFLGTYGTQVDPSEYLNRRLPDARAYLSPVASQLSPVLVKWRGFSLQLLYLAVRS